MVTFSLCISDMCQAQGSMYTLLSKETFCTLIFYTVKIFSQNIFLLKSSFKVGNLLRTVYKEDSIYNFNIKIRQFK